MRGNIFFLFMWHWCVLKCMGKVCSLFPPKGPSPPGILMNKLIRIKSIMRITNDTNLQICWQLWPHPSSHLLVAQWSDQAKEVQSRSFTAHELRVQPCEIISQLDYKAVIRQGSSGGPGQETVNCPRETWSHFERRARYSWLQIPLYVYIFIFFSWVWGGKHMRMHTNEGCSK